LYYRLRVFPIEIPPLRERREDIPVLVNYFVHKHSRRMNRQIAAVPPETMELLRQWGWPGNVRELENFMERAVILTQGPILRAPLSELKVSDEAAGQTDPNLENAEREHILRVLREAKGMIGGTHGAAERLGLKRTTLNSKMKKLGIKRKDYI
jgi:formate hydrogenlyase transcriptional activator